MTDILVLDQGGQSSRACLFSPAGEKIASSKVAIKTRRYDNLFVEHDADELIESLLQASQDVLKSCSDECVSGLATQRSSIVCWDTETGQPLTPVISWQDRRAYQWMQQFQSQKKQIYQASGLFPTAYYGASKIKWCLSNVPDVVNAYQNQTLCCGSLASYIIFKLTKERQCLCDAVNASRTLLCDVKSLSWSSYLLKLFGIDDRVLPKIVPNHYSYGILAIDGFNIPLTLVTGDQSSALFGFGQIKANTLAINMGTGVFIQRPIPSLKLNDDSQLLISPILQNNKKSSYVIEGTVNGGASAIASMDELLSIQQSELEKLTFPVNDSDKIPLFINGVGGVGSPYWLPNIKSQFIGEGTGRQKMIAVLESIAFLIKKNIDSMAEISAVSEKAFISGGLSNNAYLVGALMQLTGLRLCQSMDHELTIKGIAYLITGKECFTSIPNEIPSVVKDAGLLQRYHYWEKQMGLLVAE